jgi:hypothetical protein
VLLEHLKESKIGQSENKKTAKHELGGFSKR